MNVMIDIETLGPDTIKNPIIQIGACSFDDTFKVCKTFRQSLSIPLSREPNDHTLEWWSETDRSLLAHIRTAERPFCEVLEDLRVWFPTCDDGRRARVWAWPAHSDLPHLFQYAREFNRRLLYQLHPSLWIDCHSWVLGHTNALNASMAASIETYNRPPITSKADGLFRQHDALFDALWQVEALGRFAQSLEKPQ